MRVGIRAAIRLAGYLILVWPSVARGCQFGRRFRFFPPMQQFACQYVVICKHLNTLNTVIRPKFPRLFPAAGPSCDCSQSPSSPVWSRADLGPLLPVLRGRRAGDEGAERTGSVLPRPLTPDPSPRSTGARGSQEFQACGGTPDLGPVLPPVLREGVAGDEGAECVDRDSFRLAPRPRPTQGELGLFTARANAPSPPVRAQLPKSGSGAATAALYIA